MKPTRRRIFSLAAALVLMVGLLIPEAQAASSNVAVKVNGATLSGAQLIGNTTYVPFAEFCRTMGASSASVSGKTGTAKGDYTVQATAGDPYVVANGRYLYTGSFSPVRQSGSSLLVPVRPLARAYGASVSWDAKTYTATVTGSGKLASGSSTYDSTDLHWLSRIISAEARGESLAGKIGVGNVVLNRVASKSFPNTVKGVVFEVNSGVYQFTPAANGSIHDTPTEESVIAAKLVLDGASAASDALYFFNPSKTSASWIVRNCTYLVTIGNHAFYR
ncbi:MAG: cell wall hydrolase [Candidatus Onthomonas sp.]